MNEKKRSRNDMIETAYDAIMDVFEALEPMEAIGIMAFCLANIAHNATTVEGKRVSIKRLGKELMSIALKVPDKAKLKDDNNYRVIN